MTLRRLDAELTRRGLARSREHARVLIDNGSVRVKGTIARKPATQVDVADPILVAQSEGPTWASRGSLKLLGALTAFPEIQIHGRRALDAGASTGGFTDVLLHEGATEVLAIDVGYGQIAWSLREDPRVILLERTNVRHLEPEQLPFKPDLVVADLSFISLCSVLPALARCICEGGDLCVLVKPQFEVGRENLRKGVVRDPAQHAQALSKVADSAGSCRCWPMGVTVSPLPGPAGNIEFFLWLRRAQTPPEQALNAEELASAILRAVEGSPGE
jgi:23S rRNA (cytidine1920-2'-O)/16S rRNA (cytidine1409-2'-O)-methyltransferase